MAFRKKSVRRTRRRRPRRRAKRSRRTRTLNGMPSMMKRRLVYSTTSPQLAFGDDGTVHVKVFSANSLFKPELAAIPQHQPRGFDQYMLLYKNYTVIGCRLTCQVSVPAVHDSFQFGLSISGQQLPLSTGNDYLESRFTRSRVLNTGSARTYTFSTKVNPNKFLAISKPMSAGEVRGSAISSPVQEVYLHAWGENMTRTGTLTVRLSCSLQYIAVFSNPILPAQS